MLDYSLLFVRSLIEDKLLAEWLNDQIKIEALVSSWSSSFSKEMKPGSLCNTWSFSGRFHSENVFEIRKIILY